MKKFVAATNALTCIIVTATSIIAATTQLSQGDPAWITFALFAIIFPIIAILFAIEIRLISLRDKLEKNLLEKVETLEKQLEATP